MRATKGNLFLCLVRTGYVEHVTVDGCLLWTGKENRFINDQPAADG